VVGALLLLVLAYFFVSDALPLFEAEALAARFDSCDKWRGRLFCELGNLITWLVPPSMRGVAAGTGGLLMAAVFVFVAWLLVKPVLPRLRKT
jgi:hypothetical protein